MKNNVEDEENVLCNDRDKLWRKEISFEKKSGAMDRKMNEDIE
jgi:hypothetical protein